MAAADALQAEIPSTPDYRVSTGEDRIAEIFRLVVC
jgi:hypothetical protein